MFKVFVSYVIQCRGSGVEKFENKIVVIQQDPLTEEGVAELKELIETAYYGPGGTRGVMTNYVRLNS
jgi:hypothetical protein